MFTVFVDVALTLEYRIMKVKQLKMFFSRKSLMVGGRCSTGITSTNQVNL